MSGPVTREARARQPGLSRSSDSTSPPGTLEQAHAAWLGGVRSGGHDESEGGFYPTGYQKLACSIMSTIFWGGEVFDAKLNTQDPLSGDGRDVNVGVWLGEQFLDARELLAKSVGVLEAVVDLR